MPSAAEATRALNTRITAVVRQLEAMQGQTPTERSLTQLRAVLDRLDSGLTAAQDVLQNEADAGRLATSAYRELEAAMDRGNDVSFRTDTALTAAYTRLGIAPPDTGSSVGTRTAEQGQVGLDFSRAVNRVASRSGLPAGLVWVLGGGVAALGAGWLVLKLIDKKKPVPAGGA